MIRSRFLRLVTLWLALGGPIAHAASGAEPVAIVGATVVDLESRGSGTRDLPDSVVLIVDGRIRAVGRRDEVDIPAAARVIDGKGKYLVPGLIDGFAGMNSPAQARAYLYSGVTSIIGVDGPRRGTLAMEARPRPNVVHFGMVGFAPGPKPADIRAAVRQQIDQLAAHDVRVLLLYYTLPPAGVAAAVEHARELSLATIGELGETSYEQALALGVQAVVHTSRYSLPTAPVDLRRAVAADPFGPVKLEYYKKLSSTLAESPEAGRWAQRLGASSTALMPTMAMDYLDLPGHKNPWLYPAARILDPADIHLPADRTTGERPRSEARPGNLDTTADAFPPELSTALLSLERRYAAAGARYLAGSGTSAFGTMPGISLHHELELLVRVGLTPRQAIAAATTNYGEAFGWRDVGCLAPGCRADLLALAHDPTRDLGALDEIDVLVVDGVVTDRTGLLEAQPTPSVDPNAGPANAAASAAPVEENAGIPGCSLLKRLESCSKGANSLEGFTSCYAKARTEADGELARLLADLRTQFAAAPGELKALEAAQSAWASFADADCQAVSARWEGKPQQAARVSHCRISQALRRAQALWVRELNADNVEVPASCVP
ncbi:MAG TPA: lysozyme inhibitor LprI family protein [Thermoanaerobaculia bacterium]|jgi:uncharacterized protein YecT (DUF1311 family)|nr:lysozyme inhibitor LprI family protein [Thermoanaerobaculia bacterium]